MINLTRFTLSLRHTHKEGSKDVIDREKNIKIKPKDNENMLRMKEQIAEKLKREESTGLWTYWYVVAEIEAENGEKRFRSVVKKTFF